MELGCSVNGVIYDEVDDKLRLNIGAVILDDLVLGTLYTKVWVIIPQFVFNSVSVWSIT